MRFLDEARRRCALVPLLVVSVRRGAGAGTGARAGWVLPVGASGGGGGGGGLKTGAAAAATVNGPPGRWGC